MKNQIDELLKNYQKKEGLRAYLDDRKAISLGFQQKAAELSTEIEKEQENHKKVILYSIPFVDTLILLNDDILNNLYDDTVKKSYRPYSLSLKEIQIIYYEADGRFGLNSWHTIRIHYIFNNKDFNQNAAFQYIGFRDEDLCISEPTGGVGFSPLFLSEEKYLFAKNLLKEIKEAVSPIWKGKE